MDNYEINKLVALIVNGGCVKGEAVDDGDGAVSFYGEHMGVTMCLGTFNYCNNPNDIMPIIIENKISLEFRDRKSLAPIAKRFGSNSHNIANDNVLRAACEVYILMNQ